MPIRKLSLSHWCGIFALLALFIALPGKSFGANSENLQSSAEISIEKPEVINTLEQKGLEHVKEFDIGSDTRAFAGTVDQQPIAVYVTPDGNAIIGNRIDAKGNSLDAQKMDELVAKPTSDAIWHKLEKATWVADGKDDAERVVYTFSDPNCPYCNQFWQQARPWVEAGKVQLRHVMVGVIRADSAPKAATILTANDPGAKLEQNETSFQEGGVEAASSIPDEVQSQLDANQMLMAELGFRGTPGIVYLDQNDMVDRISGLPQGSGMEKVMGPKP